MQNHLDRGEFLTPFEDSERAAPATSHLDGKRVGGLDFGLRNPFAAVWGILDRDDVLWLIGEHYSREKPLAYHADHLPRDVTWHADPAGAREIMELRCAGFTIHPGDNEQRPGIAAVRARIKNGTLKVIAGACPNLVAEAALYRYDPSLRGQAEVPLKEHDHALDALRYLISKIDARRLARIRKPDGPPNPDKPQRPQRPWLSIYNEELWTILS